MEGTHLSSMKQEPSSNPGKPTTRNIAFSWQPKSPSRAETSQIMNKAQTWCSYPAVENVENEVKEQAAEALILMHRESVALTTTTTGRERLKRHREEVSGKVMIPDTWGQENLLTDWIDYSSFDKLLAPKGITSAREALVAEGRRARTSHQRLGVESSC
uniref:Protein BIC1 n=1 Tax=Populus alba TaxID=43335 RepID=A0A4U5NRT2_POPAL|nr:hypothetical protein D5086_0000244630 [Populus alba]